ncbi:hypothetical protein [Sphingomonas xinjiangensis]|nr:hypothetical protein [Sphingomonas xinjiangensis]
MRAERFDGVTLYREIDALGGTAESEHDKGYVAAIDDVLAILSRRGFSEHRSPYSDVIDALTPVLDDLGVPGSDGWTGGHVHTTDLDRLQAAIAQVEQLA